VLVSHLVELFHTTVVETDVLLNINFVTIHDIAESIGDLVGEVLALHFIFRWHERYKELGVLLAEQLAHLINLFQVLLVWFLVLSDVTFHDISNIDEALMRILIGQSYLRLHPVSFGHPLLKLRTDGAIN